MTEQFSGEPRKCDWCDNRPGTHCQTSSYLTYVEGKGITRVVEITYFCGECLHEIDYSRAQRMSFVPGQGWTI